MVPKPDCSSHIFHPAKHQYVDKDRNIYLLKTSFNQERNLMNFLVLLFLLIAETGDLSPGHDMLSTRIFDIDEGRRTMADCADRLPLLPELLCECDGDGIVRQVEAWPMTADIEDRFKVGSGEG